MYITFVYSKLLSICVEFFALYVSILCSFALAGSNSNNNNTIAIELFQRMLSAPAPIVKFLRK